MAEPLWGVVRDGKVWLPSPLPDGTHVHVTPIESQIEVPAELREEFEAWDKASAAAMERTEHSVDEGTRDEAG